MADENGNLTEYFQQLAAGRQGQAPQTAPPIQTVPQQSVNPDPTNPAPVAVNQQVTPLQKHFQELAAARAAKTADTVNMIKGMGAEKPFSLDPEGPDAASATVKDIPKFGENVIKGVGKNAAQMESGVSALTGGAIPPIKTSPIEGPGQHLGDWAADTATFVGGEKLLNLVGALSHIGGNFPEVLDLMEKYPKSVNIIKNTLVGATQGGIKGAAEGKGAEGAVYGGAGAGLLTGATEEASGIIKKLMGRGISEEEAKEMVSNAGKFQPAFGVTKGDVLEHAASEGIKLTPGQATQEPTARMIQSVGERSLLGSKKLASALDGQSAGLMDSISRFADRVDPSVQGGESLHEAGTNIQNAVENGKQAKWAQAKAAYAPIDQKFSKVPVDTTAIQADWSQLADKEKVVLDNAPKEIKSKLAEVFEKGKNLGTEVPSKLGTTVTPSLSFSDAQKLRTFFFEMGQTNSADLPERYQGLFTKLAKDLSGEMDKSANTAGFANDWKTADAGWKDYVTKYGDRQSPLYQIRNQQDPARVAQTLINRKSVNDINILQQEKLTPALDALKRRVVEDITNQHFRIGKNGLAGYPDAYLQKLFGPDDTKELYMKAEIGRRFKWEINPSGTSNVMLAEHQLTHPEPSKLGIPVGAAKVSMPKEASTFLPRSPQSTARKVAATAAGVVGAKEGPSAGPVAGHVAGEVVKGLADKAAEGDDGPVSENDWIHFTDSSGRMLMAHPEDWPEVQRRDSGARIIEPNESEVSQPA